MEHVVAAHSEVELIPVGILKLAEASDAKVCQTLPNSGFTNPARLPSTGWSSSALGCRESQEGLPPLAKRKERPWTKGSPKEVFKAGFNKLTRVPPARFQTPKGEQPERDSADRVLGFGLFWSVPAVCPVLPISSASSLRKLAGPLMGARKWMLYPRNTP